MSFSSGRQEFPRRKATISPTMINNAKESGANDTNAVADDAITAINVHGQTYTAKMLMLPHGAFFPGPHKVDALRAVHNEVGM